MKYALSIIICLLLIIGVSLLSRKESPTARPALEILPSQELPNETSLNSLSTTTLSKSHDEEWTLYRIPNLNISFSYPQDKFLLTENTPYALVELSNDSGNMDIKIEKWALNRETLMKEYELYRISTTTIGNRIGYAFGYEGGDCAARAVASEANSTTTIIISFWTCSGGYEKITNPLVSNQELQNKIISTFKFE